MVTCCNAILQSNDNADNKIFGIVIHTLTKGQDEFVICLQRKPIICLHKVDLICFLIMYTVVIQVFQTESFKTIQKSVLKKVLLYTKMPS